MCLQAGVKFAERLDQGHEASCPWLGNACDPSVAQFPPLAQQVVLAGFTERLQAFGSLDVLPPIAPAASATMERSHRRCVIDFHLLCRLSRCGSAVEHKNASRRHQRRLLADRLRVSMSSSCLYASLKN